MTAAASTCAVSWRSSSSASSLDGVTISSRAPSCSGARQVAQRAVDLHRERRAREPGADRGGGVGAGGAVVELQLGLVGQEDPHRKGILAAA